MAGLWPLGCSIAIFFVLRIAHYCALSEIPKFRIPVPLPGSLESESRKYIIGFHAPRGWNWNLEFGNPGTSTCLYVLHPRAGFHAPRGWNWNLEFGNPGTSSSSRLTHAEDPKFRGLRPDSRFQPNSWNLGTRPLGFHLEPHRGLGVPVPKFRE